MHTIKATNLSPKQIKQAIQHHNHYLKTHFSPEASIQDFLAAKSRFIDLILQFLWKHFIQQNSQHFSLIAVGGYGRKELFPYSDIDILILLNDEINDDDKQQLETFCTFLWDIGLKLGMSVRSMPECIQLAKDDQTIMTSLIEARYLAGNEALAAELKQLVYGQTLWDSADFFDAKLVEQTERYKKYNDSAYNLEPNIKESPGGLRDLQMIAWVFKYHYKCTTLHELKAYDFLTPEEYDDFFTAKELLWKIRFILHLESGRGEDRLLFDYQRDLAIRFGFTEHKYNQGVEQFMQQYFKAVMQLERLNETLLQFFNEHFTPNKSGQQLNIINQHFENIAGYIAIQDEKIFSQHPRALLEIFLLLQKTPQLKGIRATTIRSIRQHLPLINDEFRQDAATKQIFIDILCQPRSINRVLRLMNRYGVLAAYLPSFNNIVARMQYDLFHIYTVDEHTLFVIRNLRRFALEKHNKELPFCNGIFLLISKPHILYIAALFHDIAKGKKGDHSVVGEKIAEQFCIDHQLSNADTKLICWLVKNHLIMSTTAQRQDISDPDVIHAFTKKVGKPEYLNYLYLLTVADIRATNPKLWTTWKDSLLKELYRSTLNAFRRGIENPLNQQDIIQETRQDAYDELHKQGLSKQDITQAWQHLNEDYFLRYYTDEIVWHSLAIHHASPEEKTLIILRPQNQRGSAEIFIYAHHTPEDFIFARSTATLNYLGLTILDARIITSTEDYTLNSFQVLEQSGKSISETSREQHICQVLQQRLGKKESSINFNLHSQSRQAEHFPITTRAFFSKDPQQRCSLLNLITTDHAGLLSKMAQLFLNYKMNIISAKITTIGRRAEDIFFLNTHEGQLIPSVQQDEFLHELHLLLDASNT